MTPVTEQTCSGPQVLGNFPRFELVFVCVPPTVPTAAEDPYVRLIRLKELLDKGAISLQEYDREKARLLGQ